jgi:hypothetical protein
MRTHSPRPEVADHRSSTAAGPGAPVAGLTPLRYLQEAPIRVVGPVTGRPYAFSGARPLQMVDPRDAEALGRASLFRRG